MNTQKHTKGEWFARKITNTTNYSVRTNERPELIVIPVNLTEVNETIHNDLIGEAIANAKLIAAAPEMLDALILALDVIESLADQLNYSSARWRKGTTLPIQNAIKNATE